VPVVRPSPPAGLAPQAICVTPLGCGRLGTVGSGPCRSAACDGRIRVGDAGRIPRKADDGVNDVNDPAAILLGYLNFSSGAFDPAAWRALNALYADVEPAAPLVTVVADAADRVGARLWRRLAEVERESPAFREATQARAVLKGVFEHLLPSYRRFHADLLEHQPAGAIERPFLVMAMAQGLLAERSRAEGDDPEDMSRRVIARLNDYVGWRPVAVLENGRLSEPYAHERVRPIPLHLAGCGAAHGRYADIVRTAIDILARAPESLLKQADFDPALLEELAIDPRAFDFLHPAASRPNYLFGLWDPARIDEAGFYRRMVVQQVTLDGILSWPEAAAVGEAVSSGLDAERRWESAAVLAGVILMAAGLSGHGPGSFQAALPLAELLPRIAGYRDEFYRWLLTTLPRDHRLRLDDEAKRMRQPFGGVRRHINAVLAGRRARQVEHVALASVFARLGRAEAAERLAGAVPAASARMLSRITSRVVAARRVLRRGASTGTQALDDFDAATALVLRAVDCGATVDPWNILGMSGQFPLHEPGGESLPDPRVEDLVATTESILDGYAAVWRSAELAGLADVAARAEAALTRLGGWWDRFATTTVSGVPHLSGEEITASAREVVAALTRRRESRTPPTATFWRQEVARFSSPRTHAEAADALVRERDLEGASGLIVHWASLLEGAALERTGPVWLSVATRWVEQALVDASPGGRTRVRRFLELVEANVGGAVELVETIAAGRPAGPRREEPLDRDTDDPDEDAASGEERVAAAYESMVWRDSTDDGIDSGMIDVDAPGGESTGGAAQLQDAAELVSGVCRLVNRAVTSWCNADVAAASRPSAEERDAVAGWLRSLRHVRRILTRAAGVVAGRDQEPSPGMSPTEFDRVRWQRDLAAERLIDAAVQATETLWALAAHRHIGRRRRVRTDGRGSVGRLFAALLAGDAGGAARELDHVRERLADRTVLYVPLSRGGRPDRIAQARARERMLERLAASLPRLGLVTETVALVQLAKALEARRPPGAASVSEFDRVFESATAALVDRIVRSAVTADGSADAATPRILDALSLLVPRLLETWMTHARQLRLSVLERCRDDRSFTVIRDFVERYGGGLFTQHVLGPASLRGILRGGVRRHLEQLAERDAGESGVVASARRPERLLADLASGALSLRQAASRVRLVLESVAENHAEYRDWNSTTTQSDRGECLHILLDFLRVKAEYDRIAWTLRPVNMAHRVLARHGATAAADAWRRRLSDETRETAAGLVQKLDALEARWSVRLASVSDRVRRPFTATLEQDELEALVDPAVAELMTGAPEGAGDRLESRAEAFLGVASGSGVEVPDWLERLGAAVDRSLAGHESGAGHEAGEPRDGGCLPHAVPWLPVAWDALQAQLGRP